MSSKSTGTNLIGLCVRRPVAMFVLFLALMVTGGVAYRLIPLQLFPAGVVSPELGIFVPNPGASAAENEDKVARPVEEQLRTLAGIDRIRSWSNDDRVRMRIDFVADMDMDLAKAEVRDRLERARPLLPDTVQEIEMWSEDADQIPVIWFGILHDGSERCDLLLDEVVKPRLEAVQGVSRVDIWGVLDDSMRVLLDEDRVRAAQLDLGALITRLSKDNFAEPLGEVDDGGRRVLLRSDMRFTSAEEIAGYPVGNGLTLGDLGEVTKVKSVRDQLSMIDGEYSYFCTISKDSQSNVVEVSRRLRERIAELDASPDLENRLHFVVFGTQGDIIEASLDQLVGTALSGGWLAVAVLFFFLRRLRLTLSVALSIPIAALLAIAWEYFSGGSFNVLTMAGLTLGIGMLVDNSIVVVENISRRRSLGEGAQQAAINGTREIALAISLSTMTTVVVFLPLVFMTEQPMLRVMFAALGIPLCTSLLFSLLVALVFLPAVAARIMGVRPRWLISLLVRLEPLANSGPRLLGWGVGLLLGALRRVRRGLAAPLRLLLALGTRLRWALGGALLAVSAWIGWGLFESSGLLRASQPPVEQAQPDPLPLLALLLGLAAAILAVVGLPRWLGRAQATLLAGATPTRSLGALGPLELLAAANGALVRWTLGHRFAASCLGFLSFASIAIPLGRMEVTPFGQDQSTDWLQLNIDFQTEFSLDEAAQEMLAYQQLVEAHKAEFGFAHWSNFFDRSGGELSLYWDERQKPSRLEAIRKQLEKLLPKRPGHMVRFFDDSESSGPKKAIALFTLRGPDSAVLEGLGVRAQRLLESVHGLSGISTPLETSPDQVRVAFDRDLALGLAVQPDIAQESISWALRGYQLPRYHEQGREIPFLIEYDDTSEAGLSTLRDLSVSSTVAPVPLSSFADISFERGSRSIYREDGQTSFTIQARVDDPAQINQVTSAGYLALSTLELPRGYTLGEEDGAGQRADAELKEILKAFALSIVLVFLLMGILFESVTLPFAVMFTVPYAVVGALWTLYLLGTTMDSVGWIGVIILAGVVVNNGIVLVDCFHRLRLEGLARSEAIIEGCHQRLRPILMTALTTVFGLLPMSLAEPTSNSIDYRALATCVLGGLSVSTFFTLWIVPLAYVLIDDVSQACSARLAWALRGLRRGSAGAAREPAGEFAAERP